METSFVLLVRHLWNTSSVTFVLVEQELLIFAGAPEFISFLVRFVVPNLKLSV